jgi:hypothetical protein
VRAVPQELLKRLEAMAQQGSEVIPLNWAHEDEDHNIAVFATVNGLTTGT